MLSDAVLFVTCPCSDTAQETVSKKARSDPGTNVDEDVGVSSRPETVPGGEVGGEDVRRFEAYLRVSKRALRSGTMTVEATVFEKRTERSA